MRRPRVYSVAPGAPFLDTLVKALLAGKLVAGPVELSATTIYTPSRRAASALRQVLIEHCGTTLLPRVVPLGALEEEEEDSLIGDGGETDADFDEPILPAITAIDRRMLLTRMILEWARAVRHAIRSVDAAGRRQTDTNETLVVATTPIDAFGLSKDLAHLIDELIIEDVAWEKLTRLCLNSFDDYWRITLDFLNIAISHWPQVLAERNKIDCARRQVLLIEREITRMEQDRGPIVAAGSTGTNRATARLLAAIARAPQGAVVLPGLDMALDPQSWNLIGATAPHAEATATHPQAMLRRLLPILDVSRDEIVSIGPDPPLRLRFVNEAMRPAAATASWRDFIDRESVPAIAGALENVVIIEAADEREEALALAIALREVAQSPAATAALVTPDRALAERVRVELKRWGIDVEDSAGTPLTRTLAGTFARLILAYAGSQTAADLLALVTHPLANLGLSKTTRVPLIEALEIAVIRPGLPIWNRADIDGLVASARALADTPDAHPAQRRLGNSIWPNLADYVARLRDALMPLQMVSGRTPLPNWVKTHRLVFANFCPAPKQPHTLAAAGLPELATLFELLEGAVDLGVEFDAAEYAALFDATANEPRVLQSTRVHPRLTILGLLEARLLRFDVALLGGLDETIWPPQTKSDPFLNRPMRLELGLSAPERRIGQTAHDFVALMGSSKVVISRALKRAGSPTVASRFLQRLAALAGDALWASRRAAGETYLALARALDAPITPHRIARPEPRPPRALRPNALSVTRIETLRRDPYAIYAEKILQLVPLNSIAAEHGPREIGILLHSVLADFARNQPAGLLAGGAAATLIAAARVRFRAFLNDPSFRAFKWPNIERTLNAYAAWENDRRMRATAVFVEERGELDLSLRDGSIFRLSATADRLELLADGGVVLLDFKTGTPPSSREILAGFAPQLTLEAAMAKRGAFAALPQFNGIIDALYVKLLKGDRLEEIAVGDAEHLIDRLVDEHFAGLQVLLNEFSDPATAYIARPYPQFAARFDQYAHLARVKEWSATGGLTDVEGAYS
jgi:ATP-dependent helicase/nuclease subunit B